MFWMNGRHRPDQHLGQTIRPAIRSHVLQYNTLSTTLHTCVETFNWKSKLKPIYIWKHLVSIFFKERERDWPKLNLQCYKTWSNRISCNYCHDSPYLKPQKVNMNLSEASADCLCLLHPAKPLGFWVCQFHMSLHMSSRVLVAFQPSS